MTDISEFTAWIKLLWCFRYWFPYTQSRLSFLHATATRRFWFTTWPQHCIAFGIYHSLILPSFCLNRVYLVHFSHFISWIACFWHNLSDIHIQSFHHLRSFLLIIISNCFFCTFVSSFVAFSTAQFFFFVHNEVERPKSECCTGVHIILKTREARRVQGVV